MKKFIYFSLLAALLCQLLSSCSLASVNGDEEGVFIMKPMFFGRGGVREEALRQGSEWMVVTTDREIYDKVKVDIAQKMQGHFNRLNAEAEFPVEIVNVVVDKAKPNNMVMEELNKTAAMAQQKITQQRQQEMEEQRAETERKRAAADKAYMQAMNLSPDLFIKLKYAEIELEKVEMVKNRPNVNVDVLLGNSTQMWDIKQK